MENMQNETIAGISTPLSNGAISIVRMSGEKAIEIADKVFKSSKNLTPSSFTPRMLTLGTFFANNFKEQALCVVFKAPKSYTGENMVEFQCHGGVLITKGILSTLIENGARLATAGEFTKRAFLNGKMALSDAEGMMDMINAQSEAEIRAGYNLLTGQLSKTASETQKELIDLLSEIEVSFDYPEEDIEYTTKNKVKTKLEELTSSINNVLKNSQNSKIIKEGVNVVILGKPNVGKSSLLNALLKDEKAIVTEVAGTTRDIIEGSFSINGLRFNLYDTAGIHETTDKVEKIGVDNALNDNFAKKEFQTLWNYINHKYTYKVEFDSEELIKKSIAHIDDKLFVAEMKYTVTIGEQRRVMDENQVKRGDSFGATKTRTESITSAGADSTKYDLIGKIVTGTTLTRKTIVRILQGISPAKFYMYKLNPEEFISKVIRLINEQKATMIIDHVTYNVTDGTYDTDIFTANQTKADFNKAFRAKKAIQDYVFTDGTAENSVERRFAEDLDKADEVCVYAKLPRSFQIPTPVGNYAPDWAIAFNDGYGIKHIYFVAETKGTMESLELRPIEQAKIKCARKLFNELSTSKVRYHDVTSYEDLLNVMKSIN